MDSNKKTYEQLLTDELNKRINELYKGSFSDHFPDSLVYGMGQYQLNVDTCNHEWIDVGFVREKLVCKHCDKDKLNV